LVRAFHAAGWYPADPITLRTSVEIIGSVLLDRPYKSAPVSPLFYEGRREDLAFEKPHGGSADRRQHVRFWKVLESGTDGGPVWLGSATFDSGVTLSRDTGQVTHRIAAYTDGEIWVARLVSGGKEAEKLAEMLPAPALIQMKDTAFSWGSRIGWH
jgi:hypothetical protein